MSRRSTVLVLLLCLAAAGACRKAPPPADLVLRGGTIVTLDPSRPRAQGLGARGVRIVALGSDEEIAPLIGPRTRVLELLGNTAYPGFIDGHGHLTNPL